MKRCNKCHTEKPETCFNKNNQQADGLTGACKECMRVLRKAWDRTYNATAKARATAARYYYSAKGRAAKMAYRKTYTLTDEQRERYRARGREHEREPKYKARRKRYDQSAKGRAMKAASDKRYARTDKGRFSKRKTEIKRKHQIRDAECTLTPMEWAAIKARFNHKCAYCGKETRLEMDHVTPLSKGGAHTAANVVPACRTCNAKKGAKILSETCLSVALLARPKD